MLVDRETNSSSQGFSQPFNSYPDFQRVSKRRGYIFNVSPCRTPLHVSSTQTNCMFSRLLTDYSTSSTGSAPSSRSTTPSPNTSTLLLPLSTPSLSMDQLPHSLSFSTHGKSLDVPHPLMFQLRPTSSSSVINAECNNLTASTATACPSDFLGIQPSTHPS